MKMMIKLVILALIASSISFTITTTSIFYKFRELASKINPKIEKLIHCPYCLGHYIVFVLVLLCSEWSLIEITDILLLDVLLNSFAVIGIMGIFHYVLLRSYSPVTKSEARRKLQNMKKVPSKK